MLKRRKAPKREDIIVENTFMSLIFPNEESRNYHSDPANLPNISEEVCDQLGLSSMLALRSSQISDYFTIDPQVIAYRQKTIADLKRLPALSSTLGKVVPILCDIAELRHLDRDRDSSAADSYLYSITEIELYVHCIDTLAKGLTDVQAEVTSPAFVSLASFIQEVTESEYYKDLNERLSDLSQRVREVRSVTIGVNLDAQYRPIEAGVISLNADSFKSGKLLDRILRLSFKNDAMTAIAPLSPVGTARDSETRKEALVSAFRGAMEDIFHASVKSWRTIVGEYVLQNTDFLLRLLPEIEFVTRAAELEKRLEEVGPLCAAELAPKEEKAFTATALYNPSVALQIEEEVVKNDLVFDDDARIYVLTGPNRGGKSVITCAVGLTQALVQLGLSAPASSCRISPVDGIFTHFPEGAEDTIDKGRLGEECARLKEIFEQVTPDSMILLDESLSSTGAFEASYIASEILTGFAAHKCRGIFSTHLHDLAASIPDINARAKACGGVAIDTLVAGIEEGRRSFIIKRAKPDGKSYARDIANKYGLSFEDIMRTIAGE